MKFLSLKSNACRLVLFAVLFAAAAFAAHSAIPPGDWDSGYWKQSPQNDCPNGSVCVEWTYTVNGQPTTDEACCVTPSYVGTTNYVACFSGFRHDPH